LSQVVQAKEGGMAVHTCGLEEAEGRSAGLERLTLPGIGLAWPFYEKKDGCMCVCM